MKSYHIINKIGHFRVPKNPHFQNEANCPTFLVKMSFLCLRKKSFPYQRLSTYPRFDTEAQGNSQMAYSGIYSKGSPVWRVISVKIMFVLMFWIYTGIKMSVVTLMRWHVELKRDITEYVLTLRRLSLNYDVRLDIMMLICTLYMNKTIVF